MQSQLHTSMVCGLLLLLVLSHCTTLVASTHEECLWQEASEPDHVGCTSREWRLTLPTSHVHQGKSNAVASGGMDGTPGQIRALTATLGRLGAWLGHKFGLKEIGSSIGKGVGHIVGPQLLAQALQLLRAHIGPNLTAFISELVTFFLEGDSESRDEALEECYTVLELEPMKRVSSRIVWKAYRAAIRKREDKDHVKMCKTMLLRVSV